MGICKCRTRTDLWCYAHKKPVCHSCITEHPVCVVRSYVEWLTDPEFEEPTCQLCKGKISFGTSVRLCCLDIFHADCLNSYASSFPPHTAIAGFTCPTCNKSIIPTNEANTPLVQSVKNYLQSAPWVHNLGGLGVIENNGVALSMPSGSVAPIPVTDISGYSGRKTRAADLLVDPDDDKYSKRPVSEMLTNLGFIEKKKPGNDLAGTRNRRPLVSTRRILIFFALVTTLATVLILYQSLSIDLIF